MPAERRVAPSAPQLIRFAIGNAMLGWRRSLLLWVIFSAIALAAFVGGAGRLSHHLRDAEARRVDGSMIFVARSTAGLDAHDCDRLGSITGVVRAGAVGQSSLITIRPGVVAPRATITVAMMTLLLDGSSPSRSPSPSQAQALIGDGLAARLALAPGDDVAGTYVLADRGQRTESLSASVAEIAPAIGSVQECWLELTPSAYDLGDDILVGALLLDSPDLKVAPLVFDGGPQRFDPSALDRLAMAAGVLGGLVAMLVVGLRRIDLALYRLLGLSAARTTLVVFVEIALAMAGAMCVATMTCLVAAAMDGPLPRAVIAAGSYVCALSLTVGLSIAVVDIALQARASRQLAVLREGS